LLVVSQQSHVGSYAPSPYKALDIEDSIVHKKIVRSNQVLLL